MAHRLLTLLMTLVCLDLSLLVIICSTNEPAGDDTEAPLGTLGDDINATQTTKKEDLLREILSTPTVSIAISGNSAALSKPAKTNTTILANISTIVTILQANESTSPSNTSTKTISAAIPAAVESTTPSNSTTTSAAIPATVESTTPSNSTTTTSAAIPAAVESTTPSVATKMIASDEPEATTVNKKLQRKNTKRPKTTTKMSLVSVSATSNPSADGLVTPMKKEPTTDVTASPTRNMDGAGTQEGSSQNAAEVDDVSEYHDGDADDGRDEGDAIAEDNLSNENDGANEDESNNGDDGGGEDIKDKNQKPVTSVPSARGVPYHPDSSSSAFLTYFLMLIVGVVSTYIIYHNRQKLKALILEGRRSFRARRENRGGSYSKLSTKSDEFLPSAADAASARNYIY